MDLRGLLHEIMSRRDDLAGRERLAMLALQQAARKVCRETLLLRAILSITSGTYTPGMKGEVYYRPATITPESPVPLAADADTKAVAYDVVRYTDLMALGTDSTKLLFQGVTKSKLLDYAQQQARWPASLAPTPQSTFLWADAMGTLLFYPVLPAGMLTTYPTLTVEAALVPTRENFETIDLPAEAEDAIIQLAMARAYEYDGAKQNPTLALSHETKGMNLCAALRVLDKLGTSGDTGRGQESPFNFSLR